jgi:oxygen-independent coproporphyrinogen-3 oxidase
VPNVNLDLMFGVPGQTRSQWIESIRRTVDLSPDHISAYCLTYEEDTEFFERFQRGEMGPQEDRDSDFFEVAMNELEAAGYPQYEISNYARPGRECLHNLGYWRGADYAGLGPSAFSTRSGWRRRNVADTADYTRQVLSDEDRFDFVERIDDDSRRAERIAFSLRTTDGVPETMLPENQAAALVQHGLVTKKDGRVYLTREGRLVADEIAAELI